ncbi:MAG: HAD-IB family phosphatase [Gemmatimonadales bacterium]
MTGPGGNGFASVVLDVDSTLCGIEGIDWLASLRGNEIADLVAAQTDRAMRGELRLEDVYGERLSLVRPRREDADALGREYIETLAPGARQAIQSWRVDGIHVVLVSSAIRHALLPVARHVGLDGDAVHAVEVTFDQAGAYAGFDRSSPLTTARGKLEIVLSLDLPKPILMVGDGSTDLAARDAADAFTAFTGFVTREEIVQKADFTAKSFDELSAIARGEA